eukprot:gene29778-23700_t
MIVRGAAIAAIGGGSIAGASEQPAPKHGALDALRPPTRHCEQQPGGRRHRNTGAVAPAERWDRKGDADAVVDAAAPRHVVLDDASQRRRVVIVGDIHGCCDEFRDLLRAVGHRQGADTLILAGDLVNKGPKSVEVVRVARELGALAVLGNHELQGLHGAEARGGGVRRDVLPGFAWTDDLSPADVAFLRRLPYTISLPLHNVVVVHAGLQSRWDMTTMRNLVPAAGARATEGPHGATTVGGPRAATFRGRRAIARAPCAENGPPSATEKDHVYGERQAAVHAAIRSTWSSALMDPHGWLACLVRRRELQPPNAAANARCMYGKQLTAAVLQLGHPPGRACPVALLHC